MANEIFENIWKIMKENKFQLIDQINNDLICNICNKLMVKACIAPCGCKYCSDCIAIHLDSNDTFCPGKGKFCQMKMINFEKDIVIDYRSNIKIAEIVVKCPIKFCEFTGEFSVLENHMKTCNKSEKICPYFEIGCKNNVVINDEMNNHLSTEIYCHTKLLFDCINNLRNEMESIKNEIVELKSENKLLKEELDIIKIESKNNQMKNQEFENKINNNSLEIEELNEEMVVIKNENRTLMNKLKKIEKSRINDVIELMQKISEKQRREINEVKEIYEQIENENIETKRKFDEIFDKNTDLSKKSNDYEVKIKYLQKKIIEMQIIIEIMNFGEFEWKIENLSQQQQETNIYSVPFYSHQNGYKLCLSVLIYFDYIHVYCYLMKGEFDNNLVWPFKYGITIDIINQINGTVHTTRTIKYDGKHNDQMWSKPTTGRNDAIYFHQINKSKEIIRNNQMIIKCKINI